MKALVTGGCGFIGSNLVDYLVEQGHDVYVWDNLCSESSNIEYMRSDVDYTIKDVRHITDEQYMKVHPKYDVIFHLAALARIQPSFKDPIAYLSNDIMGTAEVCELARKLGSKVVYAGSSSAYGGPMLNPYAFAKFTGEQVCEMYHKVFGVSVITARFFNVYGNRQPKTGAWATVVGIFEDQTKNNVPLTITGNGEQRRDFTHVSDIVKGFVQLSEIEGHAEIANLGTGTNFSINEVAEMFKMPKTYIDARPGEAWTTLADISETNKFIPWSPKIVLNEYISSFCEANKQQG